MTSRRRALQSREQDRLEQEARKKHAPKVSKSDTLSEQKEHDPCGHTPGAWRICVGDSDQHTVYSESKRPEFIASTVKGIANARLIAAAPALLAALREMLRTMVGRHDESAPAVTQARAAIAQAEGSK